MKNFKRAYLGIDNLSIFFVFFAVVYFTFSNGPIMSSDSYQYEDWANLLIENSFNIKSFSQHDLVSTPSYFYIVNIYIFSFLIYLSPEYWKEIFLFLNCICIGLILLNMKFIINKFVKSKIVVSLACFIYLLGDSLLWPSYILLDVIYSTFVLAIVNLYLFINKSKKLFFYMIPFLILLTMTKPQSLGIIFGFFMVFIFLNEHSFKTFIKYRLSIITITSVLSALLASFIFFTDIEVIKNNMEISLIKQMMIEGEIIRDRPETWTEEPQSTLDIMFLFYTRMLSFFKIWVQDFSLTHNLMFFIVNFLFLLSAAFYFTKQNAKAQSDNMMVLSLMFLIIYAGTIFHSMTLLDHDWRYKFAYMPEISIFVSIIIYNFLSQFVKIKAYLQY